VHQRSLLKELRGGILLIAIAVALTALGHHTSAVRSLERANLDMLYTYQGASSSPGIDIVTITDDDYAQLFDRRSPLDPALVVQIINGIAAAGAKVIGVDILTDSWSPEVLRSLDPGVPIVWIRDTIDSTKAGARLGPILGGTGQGVLQGPEPIHQILGVAREFEPVLRIAGDGLVPSFTQVITAKAADPNGPCCVVRDDDARTEPIPYIGPTSIFRRFTAGTVLTAMQQPEWRQGQVMKDHIVLLGGTFDPKDSFDTPEEHRMYGVAVLANIIGGQKFDEAHWATFLALDFAVGVVLLIVGYYIGGIWRLGMIMAVVIAVSLGSLFLFQYFRMYLSFMPVLVGIAIHFLLEQLHHQRELRRRYAEVLAQNADLIEELQRSKAELPS
jgi:CHASE2 domain-containing sensor protein